MLCKYPLIICSMAGTVLGVLHTWYVLIFIILQSRQCGHLTVDQPKVQRIYLPKVTDQVNGRVYIQTQVWWNLNNMLFLHCILLRIGLALSVRNNRAWGPEKEYVTSLLAWTLSICSLELLLPSLRYVQVPPAHLDCKSLRRQWLTLPV